jgi:hypothetical protein
MEPWAGHRQTFLFGPDASLAPYLCKEHLAQREINDMPNVLSTVRILSTASPRNLVGSRLNIAWSQYLCLSGASDGMPRNQISLAHCQPTECTGRIAKCQARVYEEVNKQWAARHAPHRADAL